MRLSTLCHVASSALLWKHVRIFVPLPKRVTPDLARSVDNVRMAWCGKNLFSSKRTSEESVTVFIFVILFQRKRDAGERALPFHTQPPLESGQQLHKVCLFWIRMRLMNNFTNTWSHFEDRYFFRMGFSIGPFCWLTFLVCVRLINSFRPHDLT